MTDTAKRKAGWGREYQNNIKFVSKEYTKTRMRETPKGLKNGGWGGSRKWERARFVGKRLQQNVFLAYWKQGYLRFFSGDVQHCCARLVLPCRSETKLRGETSTDGVDEGQYGWRHTGQNGGATAQAARITAGCGRWWKEVILDGHFLSFRRQVKNRANGQIVASTPRMSSRTQHPHHETAHVQLSPG